MSDIIAGENFQTGQQVTAARLNNHVNGAQIVGGAIFNKIQLGNDIPVVTDPSFSDSKINTSDLLLVYDSSSNDLKKISINDLFVNTISSYSSYPSFGSPGIGYSISPRSILPRGSLVIERDASEDLNTYTPTNWLSFGNLSYKNTNVNGYFRDNDFKSDIKFDNTVDFNANINVRADVGLMGVYINNYNGNAGYQLFSPGTILQIPNYNIANGPGIVSYKEAATRIGLPYPEAMSNEDMKGIICYNTATDEIAYRDNETWQTVASKEYVSSIVTDAVNGPIMKSMIVFTYDENNGYTIHKQWNATSVAKAPDVSNVHRVQFETPMQDVYYATSVERTYEGGVGVNSVICCRTVGRGLTYVDVYGDIKIYGQSGGPKPSGVWTVIVWEMLPDTLEEIVPE